jgi:hypothetical protein
MKLKEQSAAAGITTIILLLLGRSIFKNRLRTVSDVKEARSNPATIAAASSEHIDPGDFKGGYQTVVAIIQGVAFVVLTSTAFGGIRASITGDNAVASVDKSIQALVTLSVIIIVTFEYFDLAGAAVWSPGFFDVAIPYILGVGEVAQATWLGDNTLWWGSLSFLLLASTVAFQYSAIRAQPEGFRDLRYHRYFRKTVKRLALASLVTLTFAIAVCIASICAHLSPWFYVALPSVATISFVGIWTVR